MTLGGAAYLLLVLLVGGTLMAAVVLSPPQVPALGTPTPQYSGVQVSSPSRDAALAAMEQLTSPSDILGAQGVQITLGTSNLPSQDPVARYLQALSNFASSIQQIKSGLQIAQRLASSGDDNGALLVVNRLIGLRNQTGNLLTTLYSMLDLIQQEPNTSQSQIQFIRQRLDGLRRVYVEYSIEIDQLKSEVTPRTVSLTISFANATVFIEQPVVVSGRLQTRNGTAMPQRNLTISWAQNRVTVFTDANGTYSANISFPIGYPNGTAVVGATFQPAGTDAKLFVTTNATAFTQLEYYPTRITAELSSGATLPLDIDTVTGTLTTAAGTPLDNRTVRFQFDNNIIGNGETTANGTFTFTFQVPPSAPDGKHAIQAFFVPNAEPFAPAIATVPLAVQREQTTISAQASPNVLLSGMSLRVTGRVSLNQSAISYSALLQGNVTMLIDGIPYTSSQVSNDGTFSLNLPTALNARFGTHVIQLTYVPLDPRMDASTLTQRVYLYNSELIAIAAVAGGLASELILIRRRRRSLRLKLQETEPSEESVIIPHEIKKPMTLSEWDSALKSAEAENDAARKVVICYRLAQNLVANRLSENITDTETHLEFYTRVVELNPPLAPDLKRLVELFELAEYSQFVIDTAEGDEAEARLLKIRDVDWS